MRFIAPIVEGHGEQEAVPALLHRIASAIPDGLPVLVNPPIRVKSGSFLKDQQYFAKYVALAAAKAAQKGGSVLILLDCDDDCAGVLGPALLSRAKDIRSDVAFDVVLACREYESWFVAAIRSLRGLYGLPSDIQPPGSPDQIRDAKGWLGERMNVAYDPVTHQLEFTRKFDLQQACTNHSFERLLDIVMTRQTTPTPP